MRVIPLGDTPQFSITSTSSIHHHVHRLISEYWADRKWPKKYKLKRLQLISTRNTWQRWQLTTFCPERTISRHLAACGNSKVAFPVSLRAICSAVSRDFMQKPQAVYLYIAFHKNWQQTNGFSSKIISPSLKFVLASQGIQGRFEIWKLAFTRFTEIHLRRPCWIRREMIPRANNYQRSFEERLPSFGAKKSGQLAP